MSAAPKDPIQQFANLFKGGQGLWGAPGTASGASGGPSTDPMAGFAAFTHQMAAAQQQFLKQMTTFWTGQAAGAAETAQGKSGSEDRRFAAEAWRNDPRFDLVRRSYGAYSDFVQGAVESVPGDEPPKAQMRFGMRQFVDAMSPSNFFLTNPEAMQVAAETGG